MINSQVARVLMLAASQWAETPDLLLDDQRNFAGCIIDGRRGRVYAVTVCEVRGPAEESSTESLRVPDLNSTTEPGGS